MESTEIRHIAIGTLFESARLKAGLDTDSQSHLNGCDLCSGRLHWMETAANLGTQELDYEPPRDVLDKVLQLSRRPSLIKQLRNFIVASMTFDSFNNLAPAGVRHSETTVRQITYETDEVEIAISVQPSQAHAMTLTGQVLRKDGTAIEDKTGRVELVLDGDHVAVSSLSPWGEFVFPNVPSAAYALQVSVLDRVVRIPALP